MIAIFKREFKSYMHSVIGPLFISAVLGMFSLFFIIFNLLSLNNNINGTLFNLGFWGLMFLVPILCMKAFSEERRSKTDQLILTSPVSVKGIVLGKFFAIAAVFAIPTAVFCIMPVVLSLFGTVPFLWNYTSILGFFLYGLMLIAICTFISNLSDNPIVCAVISILVILICNLSSNFYNNIESQIVKDVFSSTIDFSHRLEDMMTGNCDLTSIIYFLTVTILFLFLTTQVIQKRRYAVSRKNFSITAYSSVTIIVMIICVVAANFGAIKIPDNIREVDVTPQSLYSLSDDTKKIAEGIEDDIKIYFFAQEDDSEAKTKDESIEKLLNEYTLLNKHITLEYIDPVLNPQFAKKYTDDDVAYSSVIVENTTTGRNKVISYNDMFETSIDYSTYQQTVTGDDIEGEITYALQYVCLSDDQLMNAYQIVGHNEFSFESSFSDVLSKNNMNIHDLNLLTSESVPEDCELLIINSPIVDYSEDEVKKVIDYLDSGKNVLIITYYQTQGTLENFAKILDYYGVSTEDGVLIENDTAHYIAGSDPFYLLPIFGTDTITDGISSEGYGSAFTPLCQPLNYEARDDVNISEILKTSDDAYIQYMDSQDHKSDTGSWLVGLKAEKELDSGGSTAVIYSSGDMFTDGADQMVMGNNLRLFKNSLDALVSFDTELVTIPVKQMDQPLSITSRDALLIMAGLGAAVILIFISGLVVWSIRRKK